MVLPSPDGRLLATVSQGLDQVAIWARGGHQAIVTTPATVVSSISWDQMRDVWIVTADGDITMLSAAGVVVQLPQINGLTALSIAPDGVRVAAIIGGLLQLRAIIPTATQESQPGHFTKPSWNISGGDQSLPVGTTLSDVRFLAWYDQDNLLVVAGSNPQISQVPVNGGVLDQSATQVPVPWPDGYNPVSIAADTRDNLLVAALTNAALSSNQLWIATSVTGTWQPLGPGTAPAYGGPSPSGGGTGSSG